MGTRRVIFNIRRSKECKRPFGSFLLVLIVRFRSTWSVSPNSRLNAALRPGGAKSWCRFAGCCALAGFLAGQGLCADANNNSSPPYGLTERPTTKPYLEMPETDRGSLPPKLSQTGAFKNTAALTPSESLIPYDINLAFYSDGAAKARWIALPKEGSDEGKKIKFTPSGEWQF